MKRGTPETAKRRLGRCLSRGRRGGPAKGRHRAAFVPATMPAGPARTTFLEASAAKSDRRRCRRLRRRSRRREERGRRPMMPGACERHDGDAEEAARPEASGTGVSRRTSSTAAARQAGQVRDSRTCVPARSRGQRRSPRAASPRVSGSRRSPRQGRTMARALGARRGPGGRPKQKGKPRVSMRRFARPSAGIPADSGSGRASTPPEERRTGYVSHGGRQRGERPDAAEGAAHNARPLCDVSRSRGCDDGGPAGRCRRSGGLFGGRRAYSAMWSGGGVWRAATPPPERSSSACRGVERGFPFIEPRELRGVAGRGSRGTASSPGIGEAVAHGKGIEGKGILALVEPRDQRGVAGGIERGGPVV
jgi:hypothetical protein